MLVLGDFSFRQLINKPILLDLFNKFKGQDQDSVRKYFSFCNTIEELLNLDVEIQDNQHFDIEWFKTLIKRTFHLNESALSDRPEDLLNGNIILVLGNHDLPPEKYKNRNLSVIDGFYYKNDAGFISTLHNPIPDDKLVSGFTKYIKNKKILFCHYAVYDSNVYDRKNPSILPRTLLMEKMYKLNKCSLNIHGHLHSKTSEFSESVNVSVEHIDFKPIKLKDII